MKIEEKTPYIIGVDLGTTNCAVAFYETARLGSPIQIFRIPQEGRLSFEEELPLLPSNIFLKSKEERVIGTLARQEGLQTPTRLIYSAKSWLSNAAASRKEKILPFEAAADELKLSPVEASAAYLSHIKKMWNRQIAKNDPFKEFEEQKIIITVPASFDAVARALTVEAADLAGLKKITLLEEPQAAFYSWLIDHDLNQLKAGDTLLVCDIGGGTSDFSLIDVIAAEDGTLELRRMAVGKHLLLGGDNMDLALMHALEQKICHPLTTKQRLHLLQMARTAKESLLTQDRQESFTISIAGEGSKLIGGGIQTSITCQEVEELVVEGFFGLYSFEEALILKKGSGIRQMGLGFEAEPSITKQLASFLHQNGCTKKPTHLLFNGGALKPSVLQERLIRSLNQWYEADDPVKVLNSYHLDLSVARGAAFFGRTVEEKLTRIKGGIPRTYYLEIETGKGVRKALTLLSRGVQENTRLVSDHRFFLTPNAAISFQLHHSPTRLHDKEGEMIDVVEEELIALPLIQTICRFGKGDHKELIPVKLEIFLTAIGTLELTLLSQISSHQWKLEFQLQGEGSEKRMTDLTFDAEKLLEAELTLKNAFAVGAQELLKSVMSDLEKKVELEKRQWSPSLLRHLFDQLLTFADKRHLSSFYEAKFWNLAGFFIRPGFGFPIDEHRIKAIWKLVLADLKKPKSEEVLLQQWICYRRMAAGLSKGQQMQLFSELNCNKEKLKGYPYAEWLRAQAAFELIEPSAKIKLGKQLLTKIVAGKGEPCDFWALGRLGARLLFHGSGANVIPKETCEEWIRALIKAPHAQGAHLGFTLAMLARKSGFQPVDISPALLDELAPLLGDIQDLVYEERSLSFGEQERFFGDSLPPGLALQSYSPSS